MAELIEHIERHLGTIESGWSKDADGETMPFSVARIDNPSGPGTVAFVTLGLSRHELHGSRPDKSIRCELLMLVTDDWRDGPMPGILQQVASGNLASHHALLRGEVVGPWGPLVAGSQLEALYATMPVYLPDEFATCEVEGNQVIFIWLIPVSAGEAAFVTASGWPEFEDALAKSQLQLMDLHRPVLTFDAPN